MTYRECYEKGVGKLTEAGVPEASLDARLLLEYVCDTDRNTLLAHSDREVTADEQNRYKEIIARRAGRIPLQQLTGTQEFMGLRFTVNEHVLVPRQDTEILVEEVLRSLHDGMRILDMCTGSGCIILSLLHYSNDCEGVGVDISGEALAVAAENARRLCEGSDLTLTESDLFEHVEGRFDIIVSNPPYIRRGEIAGLMPEVREHEPLQALDGGEDGLFYYRAIVEESRAYLVSGGLLYFEIGFDQTAAVTALMEQAGFVDIQMVKDYAGLDRVVYGTWIVRT
ncbi:MAG: peptide chain release factor N(5)-glutamine methyltransferase [Butyrivibrio sp.]|nr:peptide chain release factor N(5)-glutamine methyltransferase [Muribaculum sp.]MCM1553009.1 peptide chain release factor N(5)-glutamine methyltransferase [Butyrivibrio sp.]